MTEGVIIGLHICGRRLRRAELRHSGAQLEVLTAETAWPPDGAVLRPPDATSDAGAGGGGSGGPVPDPATRCIAALPAAEVMTRFWSFPHAEERQLRQMIAHRLEADLPVPVGELTWAHRTGDALAGDGQRSVLAQAVRTAHLARDTALLTTAGFTAYVLTTEAEALGALLRYGLAQPAAAGAEALVVVGPDDWLVGVLEHGLVRALRRVHADPARLELACRQCQQTIEAQVPRQSLRRIRWCAPAEQAETRCLLGRQMGLEIELAEPAPQLVAPGGVALTPEQLAAFGPAIGLALAGAFQSERLIRLGGWSDRPARPHSRIIQDIMAHPWRWTAAAAGMLLLALVVHIVMLGVETHKLRSLLATQPPGGSPLAALQPKVRAMQRIETYRIDVERIVADLCKPIPDMMVLSSIQVARERRLVIKGISPDPSAIFALADALRKTNRFTAVNPETTEPGKGGAFTLTADMVGVKSLPSAAGRGAAWR